MSENQRRYPRHELNIKVAVSCLDVDSRIFKTRDISDGGMFLQVDDPTQYPQGEMVHVHFLDPLHDDSDTHKDAVIVRVTGNGVAISYVDLEAF